jgi:hypothetical protein
MPALKNVNLYLSPTVLSMLMGVVICGGYVGLAIYSLGLRSGSLYEAILGNNSSQQQVSSFQDQLAIVTSQVSGNKAVDRFPTFLVWVLVGLVVYAVTEGLITLSRELVDIKKESTYVHARQAHVYKNAFIRLGVRMGFVLVIVAYAIMFFNWILPFCVQSLQTAAYALTNPLSIIYIGLVLSILLITFHGLVILLRFYSLRPRVLSSTAN